jgi:hypothetical protein
MCLSHGALPGSSDKLSAVDQSREIQGQVNFPRTINWRLATPPPDGPGKPTVPPAAAALANAILAATGERIRSLASSRHGYVV